MFVSYHPYPYPAGPRTIRYAQSRNSNESNDLSRYYNWQQIYNKIKLRSAAMRAKVTDRSTNPHFFNITIQVILGSFLWCI